MMYTVTIRVIDGANRGHVLGPIIMRSPASEHSADMYSRAVRRLYGTSYHFHPDLPGHPNIGRVASHCRTGGTNLYSRIRVETERA